MKRAHELFLILFLVFCVSTSFATVGGGDLTFQPLNAKPVFFNHAKHVESKHLKCSACHNHIFEMEKGSSAMDMSKITKGQFCGTCHNGERSFDVKDKRNCEKCHK